MIIIQENKNEYEEDFNYEVMVKLNEMSIQAISSLSDSVKLPFDISIKSIEKNRTFHAHIMKKGVKGVELGTFEVTKNPPRKGKDLIEYVNGPHKGLKDISENERQLIADWAKKVNHLFPGTNWEALSYNYALALRSY